MHRATRAASPLSTSDQLRAPAFFTRFPGDLVWYSVRQEREFQRLIAAGDAALAADQTYGAIEAFSDALALKSDSMLAYLKRGDTYRRRGELAAALRDLRLATTLDPSATR